MPRGIKHTIWPARFGTRCLNLCYSQRSAQSNIINALSRRASFGSAIHVFVQYFRSYLFEISDLANKQLLIASG